MFGEYSRNPLNYLELDLKLPKARLEVGTGWIEKGSRSPQVEYGAKVDGKIRLYSPTLCVLNCMSSFILTRLDEIKLTDQTGDFMEMIVLSLAKLKRTVYRKIWSIGPVELVLEIRKFIKVVDTDKL